MLKIFDERKRTLQNEVDRLAGKVTHAGGHVLDVGDFSATECAKFFELNSRLRVYNGDAMNGDDVLAIRRHVVETVARLTASKSTTTRGRKPRENSAIVENTKAIRDECEKILAMLEG